jgi:hypothetical protein
MEDRDLKKLLLETCPVLPGQEERAWGSLRSALYGQRPVTPWYLNWKIAGSFAAGLVVACVTTFALSPTHALATADSVSPGIYATAFYSPTAKAQVVWLNGMEPASDKPTYLDPTSALAEKPEPAAPVRPDDPL